MEGGEGIASIDDETESQQNKKPVKIRIAIFYDGTLNNRINVEQREAKADSYYENKDKDGEPDSYDNGRTNIAIMEPHIKKKSEGYDCCMKCYVEGQGTLNFQKDSLLGYAFGGGESGVVDRAGLGISRAVELIEGSTIVDSEEHFIEKLTIDVFGFSRGAATARYAIHVLFNGRTQRTNNQTGEVYYAFDPIHTSLNELDYDIQPNAVEVCFAGLYDTVLSYYGSQYFPFTSNVLQQRAVARAKKVLHLAAADEHRNDFPLHSIKSTKKRGGEEYYLPGVHSDVGGSYNQASELEIQAESDESKKEYMKTSNESLMILKGSHDTLDSDRNYLIKQGWYKDDEIWLEPREPEPMRQATHHQTIHNSLHVSRMNIRSAYCNIPLKIMAEYSRKPEVKLQINEKLEDRAEIILNPEPDLQKLEGIIRNYIANTANSKAEDWIGENASLNNAEMKNIRHKHFHFSASKPKAGYKPRIVWDKTSRQYRRRRYIYDA